MHIDVISSVGESRVIDLTHRTVIVIDVLRATSTIITALVHGALGVMPLETVGQVKLQAKPEDILAGERYCKKIAGFHLGNSPFEFQDETIRGKRILLTTTNGTRAIQKAFPASYILAGSFMNAKACAQAAFTIGKDVALLCAGTQDAFALEDGLCAGLLLHEMSQLGAIRSEAVNTNDLGSMVKSAYPHYQPQLLSVLMSSASGKRLTKLGFSKDVEYCAQINTVTIVPYYHQQMMVPLHL